MTDPLKLAEEIESTGAANAHLVAAALRLADESALSWYRDDGLVFIVLDAATFDAYRAAREGK